MGGTILILITSFLIWVINTELSDCDRHYPVYTLLFLFMVGGFTLILRGAVVTTTFEGDKTNGTMMVVKSNILCMRMYNCYALEDI